MVLGRLIMSDHDEGHHWFRIPLRHASGEPPLSGIQVRRADPKGGIVANQTGIITFDGYVAPVDALMGAWASIDDSGVYHSSLDRSARFVACLETFIQERLFPIAGATFGLSRAATITMRYAMHRQAFGQSLLHHLHYCERLMPIVSQALAAQYAIEFLIDECSRRFNAVPLAQNRRRLHGTISSFKSVISWQANTGLQQLRELCGGHGFHCYNEIVTMKNDFDINATFAGDNTILCYEAMRIADRLDYLKQDNDPLKAALDAGQAPTCEQIPDLLEYTAWRLLKRWRDTKSQALCEPFSRAMCAAAVIRHWSQATVDTVEDQLRRLYAVDSVLSLLDILLEEGLIYPSLIRSLKDERSALCASAGNAPIAVTELLGTPDTLLDVPIASPDYASRILHLATHTLSQVN